MASILHLSSQAVILELILLAALSTTIIVGILIILKRTPLADMEANKKKWLTGPMYFPFFGSGVQIASIAVGRTLNEIFTEVCRRYGSVCGFYGSPTNYFVFINDAEKAKEMLKCENFNGKFPMSAWDSLVYGGPNLGIVHSYGDTSKELRSRTIQKLRKFGYGKRNFTELVQREASAYLELLERKRLSSFGIIHMTEDAFILPMTNILWTFLTGNAFPDPIKLRQIVASIETTVNNHGKKFGILFAYSYLRFIPGLTVYQTAYFAWRVCEKLIKEILADKRRLGKYKEKQEDFIDSFLLDIDAKVHPDVTDEQLVWVVNDILLVGTMGLIANFMQWTLLFIARDSKVAEKIAEEIDSVIGASRMPSLDDRAQMPYTESVILEVIRMGNVVNYAMRCTNEETTFDGYHIPKDTLVMVDTECLRKDPKVWSDPNIFRPERFYDEDKNCVTNVDKLNAFGYKRPCLGENILKQTGFLFLVSILQKYNIQKSPQHPEPLPVSKAGVVGRPKPYFIQVTPRKV